MSAEDRQEPNLSGDQPVVDASVTSPTQHDPYVALRYSDFRLLITGRFIASLGEQMLSVAIGWELYDRTGDALALGLVGLVQIIPVILLALVSGQFADRYSRKGLVVVSQTLLALCSLGLAYLSHTHGSLALIYFCLLLIGTSRAFSGPASSALLPQTVPPEALTSALTWHSSAWQLAAVVGPALGGFLIAVRNTATPVFVLDALTALSFAVLIGLIRGKQAARPREAMTLQSLLAGVGFVRRTKIILATITLDMFAVLFGGAVALLPVFAKDILHVGADGLGWLRAAPSVGAVCMALVIAHRPPFQRAGMTLLWAVIGFGIATIVFGLSTSFWLSLAMLAVLGALDNISVVIRSTLVLKNTPNEMLGRIGAVNNVFVGISNELGGFESGVAASIFGPILAVVGGGIGTILVVIAVARLWPEVRRLGSL